MSDENASTPGEGADTPDDGATNPEPVPEGATENHWKQLVLEMEESADKHQRAGWGTTVLHPTASGAVDDPEPGIGIVVPREEFETLDGVVSTRAVEEYEVLRADLPGETQFLVILFTADAEQAVFLPAAVATDSLDDLRGTVGDALYTHVTSPEDDATVSFTHDDPDLFFPDAEQSRTAEAREEASGAEE
jgi:hypothetical protein